MRKLTAVAAVVMVLASAACIQKDSAATWYVDAAGHVTWSVLERDVRSDCAERGEREAEEAQYLANVRAQMHGAAAGLSRLGATQLKVAILRDKAPFTVLTEGQFPGLEEMGQRLIARFGLSGASRVVREGSVWTWSMQISDPNANSGNETDGNELGDLMGDRLTVALREGRFLSAVGFVLDHDGRMASLAMDDKLQAGEDGVMRLQLRWEIR